MFSRFEMQFFLQLLSIHQEERDQSPLLNPNKGQSRPENMSTSKKINDFRL